MRPGSSRRNGSARRDAEKYPLHLVSSQPRYKLHSQMDSEAISARGKIDGREAIAMHPDDARRRGIKDGDIVRVHNARGACLAGAVLTDTVSPGVAQALLRRLVRSGRRRGRRALRARQRQCADPRSRHVEAQPRAVDRHQHGRDRAVDRSFAAGARVHAAGGDGCLVVMPREGGASSIRCTRPKNQ